MIFKHPCRFSVNIVSYCIPHFTYKSVWLSSTFSSNLDVRSYGRYKILTEWNYLRVFHQIFRSNCGALMLQFQAINFSALFFQLNFNLFVSLQTRFTPFEYRTERHIHPGFSLSCIFQQIVFLSGVIPKEKFFYETKWMSSKST